MEMLGPYLPSRRPAIRFALAGALLAAMLAPRWSVASTADHSRFEALEGPFAAGPEVTRACLTCHTEAARQVQASIHWTWTYEHPTTGQRLGKRHVVNNFCGSITSNFARCTSCHVGYGWRDADFDFQDETLVDCLACHDTTGTYRKFPTGAGHPPYEDTVFKGELIEAPDLAAVAQAVGATSRKSCGECHFKGGGGDGVKHGDLDSSLVDPPEALDVHMASDGLDYACSTCHTFQEHRQQGSRYLVAAKSTEGIALPGRPNSRPACESCHGAAPHEDGLTGRLDSHVERVACQTCHIPTFARGGVPTKVWWDWSTAGELDAQGRPVVRKDEAGLVTYDGMKGTFRWAEDVVPEYRWFDGTVRYTLLDDPIDPTAGPVELNPIAGDPGDPRSRIWPFKRMRGIQPYDAVNDVLVIEHLFGKDETAFWKGFQWGPAIARGMAEARRIGQTAVTYSGEYAFTETEMRWPLSHMVAPADEALTCDACHRATSRLAGVPGVFLPGRDRFTGLDRVIAWLLVVSVLAVLAHGAGRWVAHRRRLRRAPAS